MNAKTYAECLSSDMNCGIAITDMLEEILISENGKIDNFQKVAENQMIPDIFSDSVQAVDLFANNPPATFNAILMDIMMPVMDAHLAKPLDVKKAIDIICKLVGRK